MQVRALKAHSNAYGSTFQKAVNDTYSIPDAAAAPLIAAGIVEQVGAPPAPEAALTGTASESGMFGPFTPAIGRPIIVTLSGSWAGSVKVLRSIDGGTTKLPITAAGIPWGEFTGNVNEQVWEEWEAGTTFWLEVTRSSGTLSYRVAQ